MKIKLFSKCDCGLDDCGGYDYVIFKTRLFQFRWFNDNGEWFLYIHIGRRWWRFSGAGYVNGQKRRKQTLGETYAYKYTFIDGNGNEVEFDQNEGE